MNQIPIMFLAFQNLSGAVRGALWMSASALLYAGIYFIIRRLTDTVPIMEMVFLRGLMGMILSLPWLMRAGVVGLKTTKYKLYGLRIGFVYIGQLAWFYGLANLPLSDATALMFTLPLFSIVLAGLTLGEKVGSHQWIATAFGFAGALIIIRPGMIEFSLASAATLFTAFTYAVGQVTTKALVRTENSNAVVFYMFATMTAVALVPALYVWETPAWSDWPWLLAFGLLSAPAQQCVTRSFAAAPANIVVPFNFLKLPFVAIIALIALSEFPDPWTWAGAVVIFASTYYIGRRAARAARST
jgi:drug/metabolite transporter (DMT)-like permease